MFPDGLCWLLEISQLSSAKCLRIVGRIHFGGFPETGGNVVCYASTSNVTLYLDSPPTIMSVSVLCQFKSNITSHGTNEFGYMEQGISSLRKKRFNGADLRQFGNKFETSWTNNLLSCFFLLKQSTEAEKQPGVWPKWPFYAGNHQFRARLIVSLGRPCNLWTTIIIIK